MRRRVLLVSIVAVLFGAALAWKVCAPRRPATAYDWPRLKTLWRERLRAIQARGQVPIIDVESCFYEGRFDAPAVKAAMDRWGVAFMAMSPELRTYDVPTSWQQPVQRLVAADPAWFMPVTTGNLHTVVQEGKDVDGFLDDLFAAVLRDGYPMMGEFFFRHYPSNSQFTEGGEHSRYDNRIPLDGPVADRLFAFSEAHDVPFQIHYEVEDALMPVLDQALSRHPKARVVWCHFGRVRRLERALHFSPEWLRGMLDRHPNLYLDTSCTSMQDHYLSYGHSSRLWDRRTGRLLPAWREMITAHPWRFLAALDLGSDRVRDFEKYSRELRRFLDELPPSTREIVAWRAPWKFMFGEDLTAP